MQNEWIGIFCISIQFSVFILQALLSQQPFSINDGTNKLKKTSATASMVNFSAAYKIHSEQ